MEVTVYVLCFGSLKDESEYYCFLVCDTMWLCTGVQREELAVFSMRVVRQDMGSRVLTKFGPHSSDYPASHPEKHKS